jgi:hypothetical protein
MDVAFLVVASIRLPIESEINATVVTVLMATSMSCLNVIAGAGVVGT